MSTPVTLPPYMSSSHTLHGYLLQAKQAAESWQRTQRPVVDADRVMDMLSPSHPSGELEGVSNAGYNKGYRIYRELVATLSSFRYAGEFRPIYQQSDLMAQVGQMLTLLDQDWYLNCNGYEKFRSLIQVAAGFGTAYAWQQWDTNMHGFGRGDVDLQVLSYSDVLPVDLPKDHNLQKAYMVIIREELPLTLAKRKYAKYATFASRLTADRNQPNWIQKGLRKVQEAMGGSPVFNIGRQKVNLAFPTVDIYHAYTLDDSINDTGQPIVMGQKDTNWSYTVPFLGQMIPDSTAPGGQRPARADDCRMFPLRRLTIFSADSDNIAYDGPSPWWHGEVPLVRMKFNDVAWEALGRSLVGDLRTIQESIQKMMRDVEDSSNARVDPPALYDENAVSEGFALNFDPRKGGTRAAADLRSGSKIIDFPVPPDNYRIDQWQLQYMANQEERMDYLSGVKDLTAVMKARQVPGADTLEKLLEMAGPLVEDMVRATEEPIRLMANQRMALNFQFMTYPKIVDRVGPDDAVDAVEFSPEKIVPMLPTDTPEDRNAKARVYMHEFRYRITESGMTEIRRMSEKLLYLQLMKSGFPVSWWDYAKLANIPNFGPEPKETSNMLERWVAQQRMIADLQQDQQREALKDQVEITGGATGKNPVGRPPTFEKPAHLETKDGGTRTTVATS